MYGLCSSLFYYYYYYYFIGDELNGGSICVVHIGLGGWMVHVCKCQVLTVVLSPLLCGEEGIGLLRASLTIMENSLSFFLDSSLDMIADYNS